MSKLLAFTGLCIILSKNAHAYIDPSSGSYILQIVVASVVSMAFVAKGHWQRIKAFLSKKRAPERQNDGKSE